MSAFEETVESSEEECPTGITQDHNACEDIELAKLFQTQFHLSAEECVSLEKEYVLHLAATSPAWTTLAASTSAHDVHIFDTTTGTLSRRPIGADMRRDAPICGVRFANSDANLLYVATTTGTIFAYDLRTQATVNRYAENGEASAASGGAAKPLTCFDLNANDRVLCAGTDQVGPDTHLLFYDTRKQSTMGAYWESHSEEITQVRFHPRLADRLATGSADGLINVFDISASSEDDALEHCFNTESSVQQLQWHQAAAPTTANADQQQEQQQVERDLLSCITHVNELHLYDVAESELRFATDAKAIARHVRRISAEQCNVVGVHSTVRPGRLFVLAGSTQGRGACMRSLTLDPIAIEANVKEEQTDDGEKTKAKKRAATMRLTPDADFQHNKQVLRCSLYNAETQMLITGGESGFVTLWAPGASDANVKTELKEKTKDRNRKHKAKPY